VWCRAHLGCALKLKRVPYVRALRVADVRGPFHKGSIESRPLNLAKAGTVTREKC